MTKGDFFGEMALLRTSASIKGGVPPLGPHNPGSEIVLRALDSIVPVKGVCNTVYGSRNANAAL